jgi:hypothetical protein
MVRRAALAMIGPNALVVYLSDVLAIVFTALDSAVVT